MAFCGYKVSLCGLIISVWGLIQLLLMGVLFYIESPAFLEDLPMEGPYENFNAYMAGAHQGYKNNAFNCLIAALLYLVTMAICGWQFYMNTLSAGPASGGAV